MRINHLRNNRRDIKATIAWENLNDTEVGYGVAVVSTSEPRGQVSRKHGRERAMARCSEAMKGAPDIQWGDSKRGIGLSLDKLLCVGPIINAGLAKLGHMNAEEFRQKYLKLKEEYTNMVY
jgi:hypothetical protein